MIAVSCVEKRNGGAEAGFHRVEGLASTPQESRVKRKVLSYHGPSEYTIHNKYIIDNNTV